MRPHSRYRTSFQKQSGAVLIIGLIFLLVLTLVGITAMRGTVLQERMAGNLNESTLAFQRSEEILRFGEWDRVQIAAEADLQTDNAFYRLVEDYPGLINDCTVELLLDGMGSGGMTAVTDPDRGPLGNYIVVEVSSLDADIASACAPLESIGQGDTGDNLAEKYRHFWIISQAYGPAARGGESTGALVEGQGSRVDLHSLYTLINRPGANPGAAGAPAGPPG